MKKLYYYFYKQEFTEVFPIMDTPVYENPFTGRGFIAYPINTGGDLKFTVTVPMSSQYEIILRYRVIEELVAHVV